MKLKSLKTATWAAALASGALLATTALAEPIKIAHVYGKTGPLEAYAKQSHDGLMLGLEYATNGTFEIDGRTIEVIEKFFSSQTRVSASSR